MELLKSFICHFVLVTLYYQCLLFGTAPGDDNEAAIGAKAAELHYV
jgi:hypothetical protein